MFKKCCREARRRQDAGKRSPKGGGFDPRPRWGNAPKSPGSGWFCGDLDRRRRRGTPQRGPPTPPTPPCTRWQRTCTRLAPLTAAVRQETAHRGHSATRARRDATPSAMGCQANPSARARPDTARAGGWGSTAHTAREVGPEVPQRAARAAPPRATDKRSVTASSRPAAAQTTAESSGWGTVCSPGQGPARPAQPEPVHQTTAQAARRRRGSPSGRPSRPSNTWSPLTRQGRDGAAPRASARTTSNPSTPVSARPGGRLAGAAPAAARWGAH